MNTIVHVAALVAAFWLQEFMFNDVGENGLGFAALVVFFALFASTLWALASDLGTFLRNEQD